MLTEFRNEPFTDFTNPEHRGAFEQALRKAESESGREYPLVIGGRHRMSDRQLTSINPADLSHVIGSVSMAGAREAEEAIETAARRFEDWKAVSADHRARYLYKAAAILRRRKHEFSAWLVLEAGKTWSEADADTAEAIDFMEYYGRQMMRLAERQPLERIEREDNEQYLIPLGVGVVIPPWNFPLAIMVGMTTASLVAGNTVVLKPASTTPVIAAKFLEILSEAGVPEGVVQYVPGRGSEIGDVLVDHPLTRFIAFTGSMETGLSIQERAAKTAPGQKWIKRVIAEMGGKNTIIVDRDADAELAAESIYLSAFGFSGQKCSACSRAVVHEERYEEILERTVALAADIKVGDPRNPDHVMGPVIDDAARDKIMDYIEIGRKEGRLVHGGEPGDPQGYYIQPTVFAGVDPNARIALEEIFGPVVSFIRARDFDEALRIANNTEYGLTGSVISRDRAHLEQARKEFHVGNLYFNRKSTGALVGVHPFGGFNMSGTNTKAGGPEYLHQFLQAKLVSERM